MYDVIIFIIGAVCVCIVSALIIYACDEDKDRVKGNRWEDEDGKRNRRKSHRQNR